MNITEENKSDMRFLGKKALAAANKYIPSEKDGYGHGSKTSKRLNRELNKLASKEITKAENKLLDKASKELTKIGVNPNDLISDDALRDPKGALKRTAMNRIEAELIKANVPPEILNPEIIKDPKKVITGIALNQLGNELEKHNIPREILDPEVLKNPLPFIQDYAAGQINNELAKYDIPPEFIDDLIKGKIKTQKDVLTHLKGPLTKRIKAEISEQLSDVKIGKTNLAEIVGILSDNYQHARADSDLLMYLTNKEVLGTNNKLANVALEDDEVIFVIRKKVAEDTKPAKESIIQYPLGKEGSQCCFCVITAFEYQYDPNDILGNRRALDKEIAPKVKNLYEIRLPMPASLASTFSANWSDYTSVWSKILRSGSITLGEGMSLNPTDMISKMAELYNDNPAVKDAVNVGKWAAIGSLASGSGIGALGDGVNEALNYLRVSGGLTINPMTQATYVGANIRNHKFSFNLVPRNKEEQIAITKIIKLLEDSQLPARRNDMGGILLDFPDVFNIRFVAPDGNPINGILEVPDSVVTSINVTRANSLSAFKVSKDYFPISYNLEINFKEMQNLVRQDLKYLRQSTEQYKALHSGGVIHADWDPNNALKDIKPFDIGTVAPSTPGEASGTGSVVPTAEISATSGATGSSSLVSPANINTSGMSS